MSAIPTKKLGRTGYDVSILGFGTFELRGAASWEGREVTDAEADYLLNAVLDSGINLIDTAIDYGQSEDFIGRFIAHRRDEYFLAGKIGCVPGQEGQHLYTAANVRAGVENSLRRMKTDRLDLVQFHQSLTMQQMKEAGALDEARKLRDEGKIRFLGSSGTLPNINEQMTTDIFDVYQIPYSALQREHEVAITKAAQTGAGTIIRGGVAKGAPDGDWDRASNYMVGPDAMRDRWQSSRLDEILDGMSRMEFMLRFTLSHPDLSCAIVGTKNPAHFQDNVQVAANMGPLPPDVYAEAKRRLDGAGATVQV